MYGQDRKVYQIEVRLPRFLMKEVIRLFGFGVEGRTLDGVVAFR
jgi:hypothetical protein